MKRLALIGSTGSIGKQVLQVIREIPDAFVIETLAAYGRNRESLISQIREFSPRVVAVRDETTYKELRKLFPHIEILSGEEGLIAVATAASVDMTIVASSGIDALPAVMASIQERKTIALANKESLVAAGELVTTLAKKNHVQILPIDSEHNALFQCLEGRDPSTIKKLILTASGGPLRNKSKEELQKVTLQEVLKHPIWDMGPKITVDSSTLVNKGLEIIEAFWLFGLQAVEIEAVIHPQSLIHGMVEFCDGTILSVMNPPSMLFPIQHVLTFPDRYPSIISGLNFLTNQTLEFLPIDDERFPSIRLAKDVLREGGSMGCFFNGANEALVQRFLSGEIAWYQIVSKLQTLMDKYVVRSCLSLEDILQVDSEARALASEC
ncbi:1-deoxy-D-xylulose-5-phosphate reductoisomerase [Chlamydia muridarum]|uniref:1-deoxy-D-xylulose 5-phosphate reductoisomerase n=1 Tax=Chlamydia muridarum (strain MoPn / Nigg) TaxID=243161 RepID=DXR_CHLMU|nr:1-deoxy-D-xylulose-5-phosphate reductoisomerase [Chlamydia muridarum]Q9PKW8.1 RecName: Full=1-deoxy-D-xylulose 5-phosphate reductoisomerase; Short=DXP reductoisomerase; AltName: Full=1-deoxyxylulose-5-phosphate reductoisomerase; AltName: Full=2-C-methyl-D-erythritol 4-phosphate synthase [Chlamydia muridarum str. Nigg]AAF39204.1 1-deoxy-D-xylulose 5-phosphate reductoisomerase [Chlamydia muridarum str. Nigg]